MNRLAARDEEDSGLQTPFMEEVSEVIQMFDGDKALGPDDFNTTSFGTC